VDVEAGVRPGENTLRPLRAQQLLADKHRQNLAGEDLGETRVVDPQNLMEDARFVHATLGHQEMEVDVQIDQSRNAQAPYGHLDGLLTAC
jgi:hypothetical protein